MAWPALALLALPLCCDRARALSMSPIRVRFRVESWEAAVRRETRWARAREGLCPITREMFARNIESTFVAAGSLERGALFCLSDDAAVCEHRVLEHVGFSPGLTGNERAVLLSAFRAYIGDETIGTVGVCAPAWLRLNGLIDAPRP